MINNDHGPGGFAIIEATVSGNGGGDGHGAL